METIECSKVHAVIKIDYWLELTFRKTKRGIRCTDRSSNEPGSAPVLSTQEDFRKVHTFAREEMKKFKPENAKPVPQSSIPINDARLTRAVQKINKDWKIPRPHQLGCSDVRWILQRLNELREQNFEYHSALEQAAVERPGVGASRAALMRRAISQYGRWTYEAMKQHGHTNSRDLKFWSDAANDPIKMGGNVEIDLSTQNKNGQYAFFK